MLENTSRLDQASATFLKTLTGDRALIMEIRTSSVSRSNKRPRSELETGDAPHNNGGKPPEPHDEGKCSSGLLSVKSAVRRYHG